MQWANPSMQFPLPEALTQVLKYLMALLFSTDSAHWLSLCQKCNQPLANTQLLGGCKYNAKLIISRHNNTFKLLHNLLQTHNGGRWPILSMDLGNKLVKDVKPQMHIETATTQEDHILKTIEATHEGVQKDKANIKHLTIIPNTILSKHKRPEHHEPDIIRATGYIINSRGALIADTTYRERRCLQLIECK